MPLCQINFTIVSDGDWCATQSLMLLLFLNLDFVYVGCSFLMVLRYSFVLGDRSLILNLLSF